MRSNWIDVQQSPSHFDMPIARIELQVQRLRVFEVDHFRSVSYVLYLNIQYSYEILHSTKFSCSTIVSREFNTYICYIITVTKIEHLKH